MIRPWQYVLHQRALEFIDRLQPRERRRVREEFQKLVAQPFTEADAEIRPPNDRSYQVRRVRRLRIVYWLDVFVHEVCIVRVE